MAVFMDSHPLYELSNVFVAKQQIMPTAVKDWGQDKNQTITGIVIEKALFKSTAKFEI